MNQYVTGADPKPAFGLFGRERQDGFKMGDRARISRHNFS